MVDQVKEVLDELKKIPGWDRFPLPEVVYKEFGIPKPKLYDGIRDWADDVIETQFCGTQETVQIEVRPPAPGGIREVASAPPVPVEVETKMLEDSAEESKEKAD